MPQMTLAQMPVTETTPCDNRRPRLLTFTR